MKAIIRPVKQEDELPLRRLIMKFLKETEQGGGDFLPTLDNAAAFTAQALEGTRVGDPCVVAEEDGKLVGFMIARGIFMPGMQLRHKSIRSWGTYVLPSHRSQGIGISLLMIVGRMAKWAGYERFVGMTKGNDYEDHALGIANRVPGMQIVGRIIMIDMSRKVKKDGGGESAQAGPVAQDTPVPVSVIA